MVGVKAETPVICCSRDGSGVWGADRFPELRFGPALCQRHLLMSEPGRRGEQGCVYNYTILIPQVVQNWVCLSVL